MKKIFSSIVSLIFFSNIIAQTSGTAGYLDWNLNDSVLTISGGYNMPSYLSIGYTYSPWYNLRSSIKQVKILNGVKSIGGEAFKDCERLENIDIPNTIETIGYKAFENCKSLRSIIFPHSVESFGSTIFTGCDLLETVELSNKMKDLGYFTFYNCSRLRTVKLPSSLEVVGDGVFGNCTNLKQIQLPESVRMLGTSSFSGSGLESISIPISVTQIRQYAFKQCTSLKEITVKWSVPLEFTSYYYSDIFIGVDNNSCVLKVPSNSIASYKTAPVWREFNVIEALTASNEVVLNDNFRFYPNPFSNNLNIEISEKAEITVRNPLGKALYHCLMDTNTNIINSSSWESGVIFITIKTDTKSKTVKLIKQ